MKIFAVILVVFAFLGKSIGFVGWEIWYQLDQKRIAIEKCENKDKPVMKCNGKCYLAKQLKKLEESENGKSDSKRSNPFTVKSELYSYYNHLLLKIAFKSFMQVKQRMIFPDHETFLLIGFNTDTFHPPCRS